MPMFVLLHVVISANILQGYDWIVSSEVKGTISLHGWIWICLVVRCWEGSLREVCRRVRAGKWGDGVAREWMILSSRLFLTFTT